MGTRHRTEGPIKNEQLNDTGNIGHKTQNEDKQNRWTIQRDTGNIGHKTQNENKQNRWTIQRHMHHWAQYTERRQTKQMDNTERHRKHWALRFCVLCPMLPVSFNCSFLIGPSVLCLVPNVSCVIQLFILDRPFVSVSCAQCCLCHSIVHS